MGETAENLARKYQITARQAGGARGRARTARRRRREAGKFDDEIVPINRRAARSRPDGCIRADTTLEALAGLKPAFDAEGTVTAGTSSPLTDGASAVLVCPRTTPRRTG